MPLNIATNVSFKDENEGDVVDSKADGNGSTTDAVKAKVINDYTKQEATDDVALPPPANYSEIRIHLRPDSCAKSCFRPSE
ncbi:hypothetical protein MAM1_0005c00563 [Mucor ambiguus]|uniref:Uncharacterized protein n=1 Tax=Mucor ambiguus TaxID=91626 RepID=A0A0C9MDR2_9FUNG|nr:hypothetical protein MAM1_0005c00563 [Mucor ambiguus]